MEKEVALMPRSFSLLPASLGEARELAEMIADSDFAPRDYKGKPGNIIIAVQMGADVGLKPMQALQNISIINGRPSIWGDAALALAMPALEAVSESFEGDGDNLTAVCRLKRRGWPEETKRTFSVRDAKVANLWGKTGRGGEPTPWVTYPKRMLQMRARGFALRDVAPDLLMGLVLAEEAQDYPEIEDGNTITVRPEKVEKVEPVDPLAAVPEGLRDNVAKGFATLNMGTGPTLAKVREFMGGEGTPEERAQKLLDWLRDEYARRKSGMPRAQNGKAPAKAAAPATPTAPTPVTSITGSGPNPAGATGETRPTSPEAPAMPEATPAAAIFSKAASTPAVTQAVEF